MSETLIPPRRLPSDRLLLLDGAMGTEIMRRGLTEADFRGSRFAAHPVALRGDNDVLCLTRPDVIRDIHESYLEAGADIIETCTFNSQEVSQQEYCIEGDTIDDINRAAVRLAREVADKWTRLTPGRQRYVAGSVGPTSKMLSMGAIAYDDLRRAYLRQMSVLIEEGVDLLLIETCLDTLNAKCALDAAMEAMAATGRRVELMVSLTVSDAAGHVLSGSTIEGFVNAVCHAPLFSIGINCSTGADAMLPHVASLAACCPVAVSVHPNAGLPDELGRYNDGPESMAASLSRFVERRLVNVIGGCCGTTSAHIAELRKLIDRNPEAVRPLPEPTDFLRLSGTEAMQLLPGTFVNVGERCNVAGSRKFLRLISSGEYEEALEIARRQVADGAMILDINMDDAMLDAPACMERFLRLIADDPEVARVPIMVDSSRWDVIERALKVIVGKSVVNSLSLKEGEEIFIEHAKRVKMLGAALIVMAFDEEGQATTYERRIAICRRAYDILVGKVGFKPSDIIFDPNILTVATGMDEHADYALDFVRAASWIRQNLPGAGVSGGVSNLSFAFRGNNYVREAIHAVFLYHAIKGGMTMAIVNPATAVTYESIPKDLRDAIEDVLFGTRSLEATEHLTALAAEQAARAAGESAQAEANALTKTDVPLPERLTSAVISGRSESLESDLAEAIGLGQTPLEIISGPLMDGMNRVGELFGQGKMFLPQVVKTARIMKMAVDLLTKTMQSDAERSAVSDVCRGRVLMATVKGDVHDIGKNITGVILECNGFEIIDLGVMVAPDVIVREAIERKADIVCLSGLITPSLDEMVRVASMMQEAGLSIPVMVGGATTSALHTALRIAPAYPSGVVLHMADASQNPIAASRLLDPAQAPGYIREVKSEQERLRASHSPQSEISSARKEENYIADTSAEAPHPIEPPTAGRCSVADLRPLISWPYFYHAWRTGKDTEQGKELRNDAEHLLDCLEQQADKYFVRYMRAYFGAESDGGNIRVGSVVIPTPRRTLSDGTEIALCDFVADAPEGRIGVFATAISDGLAAEIQRLKADPLSRYEYLLLQTVADRLAEAASEWAHRESGWTGIRPAVGYPSLPDQRAIFLLDKLMPLKEVGITLTENGAMIPSSATAGIYLSHPAARYF